MAIAGELHIAGELPSAHVVRLWLTTMPHANAARAGWVAYVGSTRPLKEEARCITEAPLAMVGALRTPPLIMTESGEEERERGCTAGVARAQSLPDHRPRRRRRAEACNSVPSSLLSRPTQDRSVGTSQHPIPSVESTTGQACDGLVGRLNHPRRRWCINNASVWPRACVRESALVRWIGGSVRGLAGSSAREPAAWCRSEVVGVGRHRARGHE